MDINSYIKYTFYGHRKDRGHSPSERKANETVLRTKIKSRGKTLLRYRSNRTKIMKKILDTRYGLLSEFVDELPRGGFDATGTVLHDGRNTVKLFEIDGLKLVVKRFRPPHLFNRIMYTFFRGTKAKRAYNNARKLRDDHGVDTPEAIGYLDVKKRGLVAHSYLVTEYSDYKPIRDLLSEEKFLQVMGTNALVDFIIHLHDKGIKHKDLNSTNVLYRIGEDMQFDFQLIDVNRMSFGKMSRRECIANLSRICDQTRLIYFISQKYVEHRGWDRNYSLSLLAYYRGKFENKKKAFTLYQETGIRESRRIVAATICVPPPRVNGRVK